MLKGTSDGENEVELSALQERKSEPLAADRRKRGQGRQSKGSRLQPSAFDISHSTLTLGKAIFFRWKVRVERTLEKGDSHR